MERLQIYTVCGFGVGSSLVFKMQIDDILSELQIEADVHPADISSIFSESCDMIFSSPELAPLLKEKKEVPIIVVDDFLDKDELTRKVKASFQLT